MNRKIVLVIVALMLLAGCSQALMPAATAAPIATVVSTATTAPTVTAAPPPTVIVPSLNDFMIDLLVLEKQCFGSAGCLVTVRPRLSYDGPAIPPSTSYILVFEVAGDESGVVTCNLTIMGEEYSFNEIHLSTPRDNTVLVVTLVTLLPEG